VKAVRVVLPAGLLLLNKNDRLHYMVTYRRRKAITDAAWALVKSQRPAPMLRVDIQAYIHPDIRTRRFDAHNFYPSVAAAVDGMVRAGLFPDDSQKYLRDLTISPASPVKGWQVELIVVPYEIPSSSIPSSSPSPS
jgi:hypothetical protein